MAPRMTIQPVDSSFRDPSAFVFVEDGVLYRQINRGYEPHYRQLMASGLYEELVSANLLVAHQETTRSPLGTDGALVIRPEAIPFISYPYEWCFEQLKQAALTTLAVQQRALKHGMLLKDASAFNIQFNAVGPVLIDTSSFETYQPGRPWIAYRQFCQHFLAPLALMSYVDVRLERLFTLYLDGIPLDFCSRILPFRTRLRPSLVLHLHAHAASTRWSPQTIRRPQPQKTFSSFAMQALIDNLQSCISGLRYRRKRSTWGGYYDATNYSSAAAEHKATLVRDMLGSMPSKTVWDLGANTGRFSRIAAEQADLVIAMDSEHDCVQQVWDENARLRERLVLPLWIDLCNPSPSVGWANRERASLADRGPADSVLALALVHHLAIANNVPLTRIVRFLRGLSKQVIVEFVPKEDTQVQGMLATRADVFPDYTQAHFEASVRSEFTIQRSVPVADTVRTLYLLAAHDRS